MQLWPDAFFYGFSFSFVISIVIFFEVSMSIFLCQTEQQTEFFNVKRNNLFNGAHFPQNFQLQNIVYFCLSAKSHMQSISKSPFILSSTDATDFCFDMELHISACCPNLAKLLKKTSQTTCFPFKQWSFR